MKQQFNKRSRVLLWAVVAVALVLVNAGSLFAAGEQLPRGATLSGGSTRSAGTLVMRDVVGLWVAGSYLAPNGSGLCSGFGCDARSNGMPIEPDDLQLQLFMPQIQTQGQN